MHMGKGDGRYIEVTHNYKEKCKGVVTHTTGLGIQERATHAINYQKNDIFGA